MLPLTSYVTSPSLIQSPRLSPHLRPSKGALISYSPYTLESLASRPRAESSLPVLKWGIHATPLSALAILFCFDYSLVLTKKEERATLHQANLPAFPSDSPVPSSLHAHVVTNSLLPRCWL